MDRCRFGGTAIVSAGYDSQCTVLEIEFAGDGQIWQYTGVPEAVWYRFRSVPMPELFFRTYIQGHYRESRSLTAGG